MARIFINGISAKSGGGRSILRNFLGALDVPASGHEFLVVVPQDSGYEAFARPGLELIPIARAERKPFLLRFSQFDLPRMLRQRHCDLLFNLSDVPSPTELPQVFLFDWAYAAFPDSPAWKMDGLKGQLVRRVKLQLFARNAPYIDVLVAQSEALRARLVDLYRLGETAVVPNAVSLENLAAGEGFDFALGDGFKLLCLSLYYGHKNLEVLLPVARLIRERQLEVKIVTTIAPEQHPWAAKLLKAVRDEGLDEVLIALGAVPMAQVPSLYAQCDALLLPTLLESFSGTYVEAMFHSCPILTSDLAFARGVCQDSAYYFDPLNPQDIVARIEELLADPEESARRVERGREVLAQLPGWPQVVAAFLAIFDQVLAEHSRSS